MEHFPTFSILIPTFNAAGVLSECLKAIEKQDYPKNKLEIVLADGGSTDRTKEIAETWSKKSGIKVSIYDNPLTTAEAGKAVALRQAKGELIALIDSDNILSHRGWLKKMVTPFEDKEIIGSEPWEYTWRRQDGFITRYSALLGMNDPLCHFSGNYDRQNVLTGKWTEVRHTEEDKGGWLKIGFDIKMIPTIGANGTVLQRLPIVNQLKDRQYLFDIDILWELMQKDKNIKFAKVKVGIIHLYCGSSIATFIKKQKRRVKDFLYFQKLGVRSYPWGQVKTSSLIKFSLYSLLLVPTFLQAIKGFFKKPDPAWFFHPLACWLTFWIYFFGKLQAKLFQPRIADRRHWSQIKK